MSLALSSQNPYRLSAGARQVGLANASISMIDFWSSFHNQASLGYIQNFSIGINQENRFGLSELSNKTFGITIPSGNGSLGMVYSYYGYSDYNRHTIGLAYGMKLGPNISAGIQTDLFSTRAATDYSNTHELTFEAGIMYRPVKGLNIGMHVFNPLPNSLRDNDIPTVLQLGAAYDFTESFTTIIEMEAGNTASPCFRIASEYEFFSDFFVRGGIMSNPLGYAFGLGYSGMVFKTNIGFITHENLGLTPSLSLVIFIR